MSAPDSLANFPDFANCLYTTDEIDTGIEELALRVADDLKNSNPLFICIMNGAMFFCTSLLKHFNFPLQLDYLHLTRYQDGRSSDSLEWKVKPHFKIQGRHVVLLDDILDEGKSLRAAHSFCVEQGAASVKSFVLLKKNRKDKMACFEVNDYVFACPDLYVFGYGMDYKHYWRNSNAIYTIDHE